MNAFPVSFNLLCGVVISKKEMVSSVSILSWSSLPFRKNIGVYQAQSHLIFLYR